MKRHRRKEHHGKSLRADRITKESSEGCASGARGKVFEMQSGGIRRKGGDKNLNKKKSSERVRASIQGCEKSKTEESPLSPSTNQIEPAFGGTWGEEQRSLLLCQRASTLSSTGTTGLPREEIREKRGIKKGIQEAPSRMVTTLLELIFLKGNYRANLEPRKEGWETREGTRTELKQADHPRDSSTGARKLDSE